MKPDRRPSDESLLRYAAGSLGAGPALVVAAHLEARPRSRARLAEFQRLGGALLEETERGTMRGDVLGRVLERLDENADIPFADQAPGPLRRADLGIPLPAALGDCGIGPWRWVAPGFRRSWIIVPGSPDARVMLLRGRPGLKLPAHGHKGMEFTLVLHGWLHDERGAFGPGDLDEADDDVDHEPVVGPDTECICLAAVEGGMRIHGRLGRWLSPILGF